MKFSFDKSNPFCRFLICLICILTLFGFFCRPVALASDASALITVGTSAGMTMVAPHIALIILLLVAADYTYNQISDYVDRANTIASSVPAVSTWANANGIKLTDGTATIPISADVVSAFNDFSQKNIATYARYLVVPVSLTYLDSLQYNQLILEDMSEAIAVNNALTTESNNILVSLSTYLSDAFKRLMTSNITLNDQLSTRLANVSSRLYTVNATLNERLAAVETRLRLMDDNITERLADIRVELYTINSNITTRLSSIREMQTTINTNLTTRLSSIREMQTTMNRNLEDRMINVRDAITGKLVTVGSDIGQRIEQNQDVISAGLDRIYGGIDDLRSDLRKIPLNIDVISSKLDILIGTGADVDVESSVNSYAASVDSVITAEKGLINNTGDADEVGRQVLDNGDSILSKFADAFLALSVILTMFFNLPILKDLIEFSLALGIFALLVNLGNTIVSRSDKSSAKTNKAGKGG